MAITPAKTINYRKNLIQNNKGVSGLADWPNSVGTSVIAGAGTPYFAIQAGGAMTQVLVLPKVYPTTFKLKAQFVQPGNEEVDKPRLFFDATFIYTAKTSQEEVRDIVTVPATGPLFQDARNYNGMRWNRIESVVKLRDMPSEESGYQLESVTITVRNEGDTVGYVTLMEAFPQNASAPMKGDGEESTGGTGGGGNAGEEQPDGSFKLSHPSGSYILLGHNITIYAVGEVFLKYEGLDEE